MTTTRKRTVLIWSVASLGFLAMGLMATSFLQSFRPNPKVHAANPIRNVEGITPGELRQFDFGAWVYRRTSEDLRLLGTYDDYLSDPNSERSKQPDDAKNKWRSQKPEYSVVFPGAPTRYCAVRFVPANTRDYSGFQEADAVSRLNHFFEPCDGRTFDVSGRVFFEGVGLMNSTSPFLGSNGYRRPRLSSNRHDV